MHLLTVTEAIPDNSAVIARRRSWPLTQLVELKKSRDGALEVRNAFTGEKSEVSPSSSTADDWEIAH